MRRFAPGRLRLGARRPSGTARGTHCGAHTVKRIGLESKILLALATATLLGVAGRRFHAYSARAGADEERVAK